MADVFQVRGSIETVQAVRFICGNFDEIEAFVGGDAEWRGRLVVATRQGPLYADNGDWIVRHKNGRFRSYSPLLFDDAFARYTPAGRDSDG